MTLGEKDIYRGRSSSRSVLACFTSLSTSFSSIVERLPTELGRAVVPGVCGAAHYDVTQCNVARCNTARRGAIGCCDRVPRLGRRRRPQVWLFTRRRRLFIFAVSPRWRAHRPVTVTSRPVSGAVSPRDPEPPEVDIPRRPGARSLSMLNLSSACAGRHCPWPPASQPVTGHSSGDVTLS